MSTKKVASNHKVEVRIAVVNVARELSFECPLTSEEIRVALNTALSSQTPLVLSDARGGQIIVPADKIGFIEIGEQSERRVGFGTL
ncbi:unannotated protein [freshwater metagenome]|jgi:hypothetical protein|uniref:Unannotated protein n=1 Tax=freshwater metagenome TaxID=449393 RepID=A0A6J6FCH9_9ZZZZ|nr:DUF3107 family protein [Actinomycetota bacterium]MSV86942.1 DUF3107 family protein [Actinomycetota bacterium]MSW67651.1 DUF3107 family protein [Actinomycetota bacterium]MSX27815.1 DUF3107 family protein [Actinomycetota bacterium]MSY03147.1 DUF3107 family protein [Actinomycetota bacterium]